MNLLLLEEGDFVAADRVRLRDRRLTHMRDVHRVEVNESLRVGRLGGQMGSGRLLRLDATEAELQVSFDQPPPAKLPVTLLLALPRPKMLRRVLQTVAAMGVPRLVLLNSYRVEKSFWQTPFLEPAAIREQLILGLEQARDTVLPEVIIEKRFKPFVEDRLPQLAAGTCGLVGHPGDFPTCPRAVGAGHPGDRSGRRLDSLRGGEIHRRRTATGAAGRTHSARGDGGQRPAGPVVLAPPGGGAALHPRRARRPTQTALR